MRPCGAASEARTRLRGGRIALGLALFAGGAASARGQATLELPGEVDSLHSAYGEPQQVSLRELAFSLGRHRGQAVRVRGTLEWLDQSRLRLREGGDALLVVLMPELHLDQIGALVGRPVEAIGLPRALIERQERVPCLDEMAVPESLCDDPLLPALPDRQGHPTWPRNSITVWSLTDFTPFSEREGRSSSSPLAALVEDPERHAGERLTVSGQFRGRNLFGDLPESTRGKRDDWVIADGNAAVWVTGKSPSGKGWRLDLDDEGDSRWWIEVEGEVRLQGGLATLVAKKLRLTRAP